MKKVKKVTSGLLIVIIACVAILQTVRSEDQTPTMDKPVSKAAPSDQISQKTKEDVAKALTEAVKVSDPSYKGVVSPDDITLPGTLPLRLTFEKTKIETNVSKSKESPFASIAYCAITKDVGDSQLTNSTPYKLVLSEQKLGNGKTTTTHFLFRLKNDGYNHFIYDPIITYGGSKILLKYGDGDSEMVRPSLYTFDLQTKKIASTPNEFLAKTDVAISPDGRAVTYITSPESLSVKVHRFEGGLDDEVVKGNSLSMISWVTSDIIAYSIKKRHRLGEQQILLPVVFTYNTKTKKRDVLIDGADSAEISDDLRYAIYGGLKDNS
ncbi:MAG TPA: hypothetical protein VF719_00280, partial [Abditibacteriaceae bacterium]